MASRPEREPGTQHNRAIAGASASANGAAKDGFDHLKGVRYREVIEVAIECGLEQSKRNGRVVSRVARIMEPLLQVAFVRGNSGFDAALDRGYVVGELEISLLH